MIPIVLVGPIFRRFMLLLTDLSLRREPSMLVHSPWSCHVPVLPISSPASSQCSPDCMDTILGSSFLVPSRQLEVPEGPVSSALRNWCCPPLSFSHFYLLPLDSSFYIEGEWGCHYFAAPFLSCSSSSPTAITSGIHISIYWSNKSHSPLSLPVPS